MFTAAVFLLFYLSLCVAGVSGKDVKMLKMLTITLIASNFMGSILSVGIADKRRKLENRAVGVK